MEELRDIEPHRGDEAHASRCALKRAAEFGVDMSLVLAGSRVTAEANLRDLQSFAEFKRAVGQGGMEVFDPRALLRVLDAAGVDYVVVGGVAAALQGSSYLTKDLDICYRRVAENIESLVSAIVPLHPRLRVHGMEDQEASALPFTLDVKAFERCVNLTLTTDHGPLDLLGEVKGLESYDDLLRRSEARELDGRHIRVLDLEGLIVVKRAAGRGKDLALIPELEALLELRRMHESDEQA